MHNYFNHLSFDNETSESRHGEQRVRERLGLPKKAVDRTIFRAYHEGIDYRDASGMLSCYMRQLIHSEDGVDTVRVYNRTVFLFAGKRLVTVYGLPNKYVACADRVQERKLDMLKAA